MKKILFTILLLAAAINSYAYDFSAVCSTGQTLYYEITSDSNNTVSVTHPGDNPTTPWPDGYVRPSGFLVIPSIVTYNNEEYIVVKIGPRAFLYCDELVDVQIPNTVTNINAVAFRYCDSLSHVFLPFSLTSIGIRAFANTNISNIRIPESVQTIGTGAFEGIDTIDYCGGETGNRWGANVRICNSNHFYDFSAVCSTGQLLLYKIIGDSTVSVIGRSGSLGSSLTIPSIVSYNNYNYIVKEIGDYAFSTGSEGNISELEIPGSVEIIGARAFYRALAKGINIILPEGIKVIRDWAFCVNLNSQWVNSVTLPASVDSVGMNAFGRTHNLYYCGAACGCPWGAYSVTCDNTNTCAYLMWGGNCISPSDSIYGQQHICYDSIFYYRDSEKSILCGLRNRTFTNYIIPNTVKRITSNAFYQCSNMRSVTIPESVRYIENNAFVGCTNLDTVYFNARECMQMNGSAVFSGCTIQHFIIGENVHRYPDHAFDMLPRPYFDSIPWRDSLRYIGVNCFSNYNNISGNLIFPESVDSIGNNAFSNCDSIISITTNARYVGNMTFADCDRLVSVALGDSTQTLGNGAFSGCFRLQNINLGGVTTIGDSVFNGCVRLENPELPTTLTTIGTRAFDGCTLLAGKLTFPATITNIGDYAYNGIGTISAIEMLGATPPTIYEHTFASVSNSTPVSVPCGAVLNYYTTNYWENFSTIVEAPPYKLTVGSNNETMGSAAVSQQPTCNNHSAIIQATAETGFHLLQWSDGNGTNPRTVNMTQDSSFTAIFVPNNSQVTVVPNDPLRGTTTGSGTYGYNAPVTMTATAYDGYHFLKWNDGNTQNPRYMAATRDTTFTAIFVSNVSTITVGNANPDWGNVSGSGVYYYMNLVSLTATPVYGYHFSRWSDGNTQNPRTITVAQDSTFTAYFAVNTYNIVASSNSTTMGSVSGGGSYTYLHEMSLTATPAYGYHFVQWNDQNTDNPRTITVTRDSAFTAQFAANSYTITSEPNDPTMGSAYGSGTYNYNTSVTLTAVAEYGYHFTQWSDGVTDNPRTVTVQNSATYTAQFEINSYILTVQSSNPAIGTTSGGGSYNYLTPVNITAIPNDGYHFTQWSDGNTDNPRLVNITQNATYTAQFAINSYAVGVVSSNSNMGSVSGSGTYNHNATATLVATAYYGYHFVQWQDGNTDNPRTVLVTDSTQYTAQFDFNSYLITTNSSNVTLGSAIGGGSYNYLSQVALTAVPVPHYHFTMWNDSIEDNPRTITVTRDSVFTAHFAIDRHTITLYGDDVMGDVDFQVNEIEANDPIMLQVDYNTAVWIIAYPNDGYHFTQWNDGNTSNPRRVVVLQDTAFTAGFAPNQYSATCAVNDNGRGSVASTGGNYNYLTSVTFTAIPNSDYHFLRWSNGSTENPITFTLTKDTVMTAILVGLTANVNDNAMGSVSHSKPLNLVEVVTATPNYGYHFVQWNDGITDNPRTMNLVGDTSVTAIFAVNNYYVTLGVNDESLGSVVGEGEYPYLSTVTITATAAEHCHFLQWSDGNTTNPRMLTVTSDTSLTAYFESDQQFQITVNANDTTRGRVEGSGNYYLGESAIITATANEHYYFAQWSDGNTSNPRVVTVTGDITYTAVFEPVMYTLTVAANDYSMGQVTGGGSYAYGTEVTIEARAFGGYHFTGWSDGVMEEQRVVTVTEDATYMALFEPNVGINEIDETSYNVYVSNGRIVVEGMENKRVQIFDITGRKHSLGELLPAGVYLVRIDNVVTKKVVVM